MIVYIVRHGETEANRKKICQGQTEEPLNSTGLDQARSVAQQLREVQFDYAFCSDLFRTRMTIQEILKANIQQFNVVFTPLLREIDAGIDVGMPVGHFFRVAKQRGENLRTAKHEGGESRDDAYKRAQLFIRDQLFPITLKTTIDKQHIEDLDQKESIKHIEDNDHITRVLIVSHGGCICELVRALQASAHSFHLSWIYQLII
ncbi:MAG: fructose-2,6-bisphosphatase [Streblomastix strix]|uniref:Fructose-2,6-bisphosphatase n=1 Tax=Streblomastix strix TaxID=222440 RepID=A0A5J4XBA2_9EUKA|nr:MAG: fructose-2,6-bisphosphatase [Streblomastix strix]